MLRSARLDPLLDIYDDSESKSEEILYEEKEDYDPRTAPMDGEDNYIPWTSPSPCWINDDNEQNSSIPEVILAPSSAVSDWEVIVAVNEASSYGSPTLRFRR